MFLTAEVTEVLEDYGLIIYIMQAVAVAHRGMRAAAVMAALVAAVAEIVRTAEPGAPVVLAAVVQEIVAVMVQLLLIVGLLSKQAMVETTQVAVAVAVNKVDMLAIEAREVMVVRPTRRLCKRRAAASGAHRPLGLAERQPKPNCPDSF